MNIAWRPLFVALGVTVLFPAGVVLLFLASNYHGARVWAETCRWLEARGETLDPARVAPPAVPDNENLALAPLFVCLLDYRRDPLSGDYVAGPFITRELQVALALPVNPGDNSTERGLTVSDWVAALPLDLSGYQKYYATHPDFPRAATPQTPAEDVLTALTRCDGLLDDLARAAAERPAMRLPAKWETARAYHDFSSEHYWLLRSLLSTLRLRATASLAAGQPDAALRDILLGFRLYHATDHDPLLRMNLRSLADLKMVLHPVWAGLAAREWSPAQLTVLQSALGQVDLLRHFQLAARGERQFILIPSRKALGEDEIPQVAPYLPRGWGDLSVAAACRWQQGIIESVDVAAHRIDAHRIQAAAAAYKLTIRPNTFTTRNIAYSYPIVARRDARMQSAVDQAITACALERCFLDQRAYPASLDALVPTYLPRVPHDVIDGAPLRYQLTADGRYRLWSVNWNGVNHGGRVMWMSRTDRRLDEDRSDCVWQYEPMVPAAAPKPLHAAIP